MKSVALTCNSLLHLNRGHLFHEHFKELTLGDAIAVVNDMAWLFALAVLIVQLERPDNLGAEHMTFYDFSLGRHRDFLSRKQYKTVQNKNQKPTCASYECPLTFDTKASIDILRPVVSCVTSKPIMRGLRVIIGSSALI